MGYSGGLESGSRVVCPEDLNFVLAFRAGKRKNDPKVKSGSRQIDLRRRRGGSRVNASRTCKLAEVDIDHMRSCIGGWPGMRPSLYGNSDGDRRSNCASAGEYGAASGRLSLWLVAKGNEFTETGRTVDDVFQALIGQLYGVAIANKLLEEIITGTPNSFRVGVII
jgi:hypothetical protein